MPITDTVTIAGWPGPTVVTVSTTAAVMPGMASMCAFSPLSCARISAATSGLWSAGREGLNMGVWSAECGVRSVECGVRSEGQSDAGR